MSWKRPIGRIAAALFAVIAVVLVGGFVFVHTEAFRRYVIHKAAEIVQESTGEQLTIRKLVIDWSRLEADVYGVALRKPSMNATPFLTCDHVALGLKILSFWGHKAALNEVILDRPVVSVVVTRDGDNLPRSSSSPSESSTDRVFDLAVRHFVLNTGELVYNNETTPLCVDLRDLRAQVGFSAIAQSYSGSLAYDHGRIAAKKFAAFEHDARLDFAASRSGLSIKSLSLSTGGTHVEMKGTLEDYSHARLQATYDATVFTPDLARILGVHSIPTGRVQTSGSLVYASDSNSANKPFLNAVRVEGRLEVAALEVPVEALIARAEHVRADYTLANGNIDVRKIAATALGGTVNGNFQMMNVSGKVSSARVAATVRGASLAELTRVVASKERRSVTFAGRTNAEVQASWVGPVGNILTHVRATITGPLAPPAHNTIPVNGSLDVTYNGAHNTVAFATSTLRTANTEVSLNGTLGNHSRLSVGVNAGDLTEITQLVSTIQPATERTGTAPASSGSNSLASLDLRGAASFSGQIEGSPKSPRIRGHVTGNNVAVKGTTVSAIQSYIDLSPSSITLQNAVVDSQDKGQLNFSGHAALDDWSFTPKSTVSLQADAKGLPIAELQHFAKVNYPLNGKLDAKVTLNGTVSNPAGRAVVEISETPARGDRVRQILATKKLAVVHLEGDGNSVHATARLNPSFGQIDADLTYAPKSEEYSGRIEAPKLQLSKIELPASRRLSISGTASVSATGRGSIRQPVFDARLQIPELRIQDQTISRVQAELTLQNQHATFALTSGVVGGYAEAKGALDLRDNYPVTASLDVRALQIGALLASYMPQASSEIRGETELHATLSGPLKQPDQIKAQVQIPSLDLAYQSIRLGLADPMRFEYANGILSIVSADIKGTGTNLSVRGTVPVKGPQPVNVSANGSIDLGILQSFSPSVKSSGQVKIEIAARGGVSAPTMQGQIALQNAAFSSETFPLGLEGINGRVRVSGNRLEIEQLNGMAGGGNLSATGFLSYGKNANFNLSVQAKSVRLRYPEGLRTILDSNVNFSGTPAASALTGQVLIDRLSFTQQFDMGTLISEFSSEVPSTAPRTFEQDMKLNVSVATTNQLNVTSSKLTIGGSANLTVNGTLAEPVIIGRVLLTQGEVFFLGKRYEIQSGTIAFANPVRTEPVLNIYAKTSVEQYNITINFVGPLDRLRTNYTSDPPLSEADIIHLVAFGSTAEEAATTSTPARTAAESVLAQGVSSQVSGQLEKLTGISQISLDPLVTNSTANPASQIAIQQRVSGSLLVTFATDVTTTQAQTVEVKYQAQKNVTVSVIRDYNGGYALDIRIRKTF